MKHNFKKHPNPIFIETGSYVGRGIQSAVNANFDRIISIELSNKYYNQCVNMFKNNPKVELYLGDSSMILPKILKDIDKPCTFWLDGHFSGGDTACGNLPVPLLEELNAIKNHHIIEHTILIDDMRLLRNHLAEWKDLTYNINDIRKLLYEINPLYTISFEDGVEANDIMVAKL